MFINRYPFFVMEEDDGAGSGGTTATVDPANPGAAPQTPPAASETDAKDPEVEKAYGKLRDAEKERDTLAKKVKALEDKDKTELEKVQSDLAAATDQITSLTGELAGYKNSETVVTAARELGFRDPSKAAKLVNASELDTPEKAKTALTAVASDFPELVGERPPSGGPINPTTTNQPGGNAAINQQIRAAAGHSG